MAVNTVLEPVAVTAAPRLLQERELREVLVSN
jgi:hypothetical protein